MIKIFHNPRCKKSCAGLAYLQSKTAQFEIIKYLETGLQESDLKEILLKTNKKPSELVRIQEDIYKKELKGKQFTDAEWVKIILENPKLLQRPIVIGKYKAVLAQPVENIDILLK